MNHVYLDHAATSPMHPEVVNKMVPLMLNSFGNPSSIHFFGRESRRLLDETRASLAISIGAKRNEIIFTSGGTESDNLAIIGTAHANKHKGKHIITSQIEHHAVLNTCKYLEKEGFTVTYLSVGENGQISLNELKSALTDETILVTLMYGNNEVGTIQPIKEIGQLLKDYPSASFHTDAVQAYGIEDIDVNALGIDLLSVSAHKINGPKGVGFLYVREGKKIHSSTHGGEQELKRRAGTENVAGIVGLGYAAELANASRAEKRALYNSFKEKMLTIFKENSVKFEINGSQDQSLPHIFNIYFPGTNVESLLVNLDLAGVAVSSGSACTAGSIDPSHVLVAMYGGNSERIASSVRFSFGIGNTIDEIEHATQVTTKIVKRLTT
ncbi:cysteine desulfurase family protein [Metabacillus herbersteinensis]|uniref:cysteine desulfurase n=1 Tax=Metabacillus herbersteinensis TaxID=283816 RepID=A0ABV6G8V6_9BACI